MLNKFTFLNLRGLMACCVAGMMLIFLSTPAWSQTETQASDIDPRLEEIVRIIQKRATASLEPNQIAPPEPSKDQEYLVLMDSMMMAVYTDDAPAIKRAARDFRDVYGGQAVIDLSQIPVLHETYADLLTADAPSQEKLAAISQFTEEGSWFEKYVALSLQSFIHSTAYEPQAALQKAQLALMVIPSKPSPKNQAYVSYARERITSLTANSYNLQGNSELAISASLEYLRLTESNPDLESEVDLLNNLIYSYTLSRNHDAQIYLSEQLLEIEKTHSSSVLGLSEMRIAGVMNSSGRYEEALDYANKSLVRAKAPTIIHANNVLKATAYAGLGQPERAREIAALAGVNLSPEYMLTEETRNSDLQLAYLLAAPVDPQYATQLFNRQLDVMSNTFYARNARDTNAMLAELENSRERQLERESAAAREAKLQAQTIDRQRNFNRVLVFLILLLGAATAASLLFLNYRLKMIGELKIKTQEAASAEKLKTEFLGMISHELRTPLNGIIGISDYLANYHKDPDIREKTSIILGSGNELLSVVESLTDMARLDAGQLELATHDADLSVSLAGVPDPWADRAADKGLTFTHFIDPALSNHHVDEDRLVQCLNILLANAISFTDTGRVHLHITADTASTGEVAGLTAIVADTGQGMSELVQSRLFKPFMQADTSRSRNHMGTGLSLAIAYALIEMMGGKLSVISREGRGTEFQMDIPLAAVTGEVEQAAISPADKTALASLDEIVEPEIGEAPAQTPTQTPVHTPAQELVDLMQPNQGFPALHGADALITRVPQERPQRILIVDDVKSNRDVLQLILGSQGHSCGVAVDGSMALAALAQAPFDLVVLDIHRAPLNGVETLRRLRESGLPHAGIPVIVLTADNAAQTNAACMNVGADLFLTKPVRKEELLRAVSYLDRAQSPRSLSA